MTISAQDGRSADRNTRMGLAVEDLLVLTKSRDPLALRRALEEQLQSVGVHAFVEHTLAPMIHAVGEAWQRGTIHVFEEHFFSETVLVVLRAAIEGRKSDCAGCRVLLTTLPGELHTLGLAMVHALFSDAGAECVVLGAQTPVREIAEAVKTYGANIVGLSFSIEYPPNLIASSVTVLRSMLSPEVEIWIGGAGAQGAPQVPTGVRTFASATDAAHEFRLRSARA